MADQKKIDKSADTIASIYESGVTNIVDSLLKSRNGESNLEFGKMLLEVDMKSIVSNKLSNIKKELVKAHVEILKDKKPITKDD